MNLSQDRLTFRSRQNGSSPYRVLLWVVLILAGLWFYVQIDAGAVAVFTPTPTPTRTGFSWAQEGQALFAAGNLDEAINAYLEAIKADPENGALRAELAQIQVYSSAVLTTDEQRAARLQEALAQADRAVELAPQDSKAHAIRAFALDWNANSELVTPEEREDLLFDAQQEATTAIQLDAQNALALAYLAEVQLDQFQWNLALQTIETAVARDPSLMDVYRVYGLVLESLGRYRDAIAAYQKAAEIAPNMTFLYISIGQNFRQLERYEQALEYFDLAASINERLGIQDPLPFIAIAKTYARQGEFFIASRNAERALEFDPQNPVVYGQLGTIYVQARNYETALPVLKCAVYGCTAEENEVAQTLTGEGVAVEGLPLTSIDVAYYYVRYASVLAALNKCEQAYPVMEDLMAAYGDDAVIPEIVAENYAICRILAEESQ